ncbi:MAG: hypothetical protein JEY97_04025 [Bacteroidales bacterium]|nr:hypothetical protein [Bacteroidales bacterium]
MKKTILLSILYCFLGSITQAQITRGATPGEIYIYNDWYIENGIIHRAIFRSNDNGENLTLQYETTSNQPPGEMKIGGVLGDATIGALYNFGNNELWVSFDYGVNWELKQTYGSGRFASGCINGEIYKCCADVQGTIWRSIDYGNEFIEITQDAKYILEVGLLEGNLYGIDGHSGIGYNLHFSTNYGEEFVTIPIDSSVAFWAPSGHYPKIFRGAVPGELYIVTWWLDYHYKIFHSIDTGYTWTQKFESEYINILNWGVVCTAGRQQGSFFVKRTTYDPVSQYLLVYIDYSCDYGETFTTYFHGAPMPQPSNYPENFSAHNIELQWTDPVEGVLPHAYLVRMSQLGFEAIPIPVDNKSVPDSDSVKNILYGEEKCIFKNLIPATVYYFKIFPYTINGGEINYKTEGGGIQAMKMTKE